GEVFNIGFENHSIADIALMVQKIVAEEFPEKGAIDIVTTPSDDNRSYHVNSDKVFRVLGYRPKRTIEDAVRDLARAFRNHLLDDSFENDWYYNVRTMKKIGAKGRLPPSQSSPEGPALSAATWSTACSRTAIACGW